MRKYFMMLTLLLLGGFGLNALEAHAGKAPAPEDKVYTWSMDEPLLTRVLNDGTGQIVSNAQSGGDESPGDGSNYENLIDGNIETLFHSVWSTDFAADEAPKTGTGYHNLQVRLDEAVDVFFFRYIGRNNDTYHDNPTHIVIYATNDDELGASPKYDVSPNDKWNLITELKEGFPTNAAGLYTSPAIVMNEAYKYIRFVVKNTNTCNTVSWRMFTYPDITGVTFNVSEFQLYPGHEVTEPSQLLQVLVDKIKDEGLSIVAGTDPGYYPQDKAEAYHTAYNKAEDALLTGNGDMAAIYEELTKTYNEAKEALIGMTSGYYNFISAYAGFEEQQETRMCMQAATQSTLRWRAYNEKDAYSLFKVTDLGDGTFTVQSVATQEYLSTTPGTATVQKTAVESTPQIFTSVGTQQWLIANTENPLGYTVDGVSGGAAKTGNIVTWTGGVNTTSSWYVHKITDESLIKEIEASAESQIAADLLNELIKTSKATRQLANDYIALLKDGDQISGNANSPSDGGPFSYLIDGNINTCVHSEWKAEWAAPQIEGKGWHNLQFDLRTQVNKIKFNYIGRNNTSGWTDSPNYISIYATNDDELAKSTAAADSTLWTLITDLTKANTDFPANVAAAKFESDVIDLGSDYRYLRFVIKNTTCVDGGNRSNAFASPSVTGITFNLSELQIYNGIPAQTSEYYTVEGMKDACDNYDALVKAAAEKIANLTATTADVAALEAAVEKIKELYVDRTVIKEEMVKMLKEANTIYNDVVAYKMITNAANNEGGQVSVNSTSGKALSYLIDGDSEDGEAIFHSQWADGDAASMKDKDMTEDKWKEYNEKNGGTGIGYHNIQFRLNVPESKFNFMFITRNSGTWSDTPNYIKILATNDEQLGASTDNADESKWDEIVTMADKSYYKETYNRELPDNVVDVKFPTRGASHVTYNSSDIDMGKDYKYIRFVVLGTNNADLDGQDRDINRVFNSPDITGISWNLTEFQLYGRGSAALVNSIPGMKEAADKLKAVLDVHNNLDETAYTQQTIEELQNALAGVKALYVDRSQLASMMDTLVRKGRKLYSSVVGSRLIYKEDQMSANSSQPSQGGTLANLIDDNYNTVFHSIWYNSNEDGQDFGMKSPNITVGEWEDLMNSNPEAYPHTGTGYHNLQVQFEHPVSKFFFEYTGRNNATWSDSPTQIAIFATNDDQLGASTDNADQDSWDSITELNEGAKANSALAYFRSDNIDLGKEYKYVRLVVKRTTNSSRPESEADRINRLFRSPEVTGITWNASEFQMYELGDRAQVNYVDGMKDAADKLYQEIAATENLKDQELSMKAYQGLKNAVNDVLALYADNAALKIKLGEIEDELAEAEVDPSKVAYAPDQNVIDELQTAHDNVQNNVTDKPTKAEIDGLIETLEKAHETYVSKLNTVQPDKWYYITCASEGFYSDGVALYMNTANSGDVINWKGADDAQPYEGQASAMWRFVPIEGKTGEYAIQNFLTTHYIGAYRGKGDANRPLICNADTAAYIVKYISKGKVAIISQEESNTEPCGFHAQEGDKLLVSWSTNSAASEWTLTEIEDDMASIYMPQNSMQLLTLPFNMEEEGATLADLNPDVTTYTLKNLTIDEEGKTIVELTKKNTFKAGEPFIITVGNYEEYDSSISESMPIVFPRYNDIITEALTVNGLVGTLDKIALNKKRMGYVTYDGIHLTTSSTVINGLSGYINPTLVEPQEGETDLQIVINGKIDAIKTVETVKNTIVNVYTIDGKLVKRNVKTSEATKGLKKGLYIVGKKKIAVK